MKRRVIRILLTLLAITIGVVLTLTFIFTGDSAKGPIEDFMDQLGKTTLSIDRYFTSKDENEKRVNQLDWFSVYRDSVELLKSPDTVLLGVYDNKVDRSLEPIIEFESLLETKLPLIHIYSAWGSKPDQKFPFRKCVAIRDLGSVPMITWEPWLADFSALKHPELGSRETRDKGGLKDIVNGKYDFYLESWAHELKSYGHPVFLRFGHEMNDPYRYPWGPQNNEDYDFINAWKYIHDYFTNVGADNAIWVWSPHIAYKPYTPYYPGDQYVDWVGVGVLNYGNVASWSRWWSFKEIFSDNYGDIVAYQKPIMISEFGSLAVGGNRAEWFDQTFTLLEEDHPEVKSIVFFNSHDDNTTTSKSLDWDITGDTASVEAIISGIEEWSE